MKSLLHFLRPLVGVIFVLASFDKLQHPGAFAAIVENYRILPALFVNPVAVVLPWVEFLCGLGLILNVMARGASLVAAVLMAIFLCALGFNLYRGLDVACGCFSTDPTATGNALWYLLRDAAIGLLSLIVFLMSVSEQRHTR
ncbi:MAG: MauE/DoxX family redox-associated membrane protein [Desulfovibrio sp.]